MKNIKEQLSMINVQCTIFKTRIYFKEDTELRMAVFNIKGNGYLFPGQKYLFGNRGNYFIAEDSLHQDPSNMFYIRKSLCSCQKSLCNGPESLCNGQESV